MTVSARLLLIVLIAHPLDIVEAEGEPQGEGSPYCSQEFQDWCGGPGCGTESFCGGYCTTCNGWGCTACGDCLPQCVTNGVTVNGRVYPPCASFAGKDVSTCPKEDNTIIFVAAGVGGGILCFVAIVLIVLLKKPRARAQVVPGMPVELVASQRVVTSTALVDEENGITTIPRNALTPPSPPSTQLPAREPTLLEIVEILKQQLGVQGSVTDVVKQAADALDVSQSDQTLTAVAKQCLQKLVAT